ncbi:MAG TPA: sn-glycerol-3-phosphate ABC transporter ATP-binding protein UgpC [Gaiellaceae bacterium]|jgi:multiple sugar transport system ATP-binding protein|nr:sn-glycerol-3-phosphate ABC transporter ATP-binding protein UgpC [Gaiellaceae bacterium]
MGEIVLDRVTKEFPGGVQAVAGVDMTIADGEFMVLVGPSGCGKTTLLRSIGGLETITSGRILLDGKDVTRSAPGSRDLAMVFQNYALYPHMTVRQNLGYALRVRKTPKAEINQRVEEAAKLLGLETLLDRRPGALSGGQMQRVAMGRAIVREPKAFLMDEPLSNLDAKLRVSMRTSLQQLHRRLGTTTIYVTHDQIEAMTLGERVAVMRNGHVQQVDEPSRLYEQPSNLFVAAFIGSPAMNLAEATVSDDTLSLGDIVVPLARDRRPSALSNGRAVVGARPESFEDAAFASGDLPQFDARVEVVESVGSDAYVFFEVDALPVVVEDARSDDQEEDGALLTTQEKPLFAARVDPRTKAQVGSTIRLTIDPSRLYFFSPQSGESLLN